jgi:hypothetical protein
VAEHTRLKARLHPPLRDRRCDDAKRLVHIAREKEIKKLANKLRRKRFLRSGGKLNGCRGIEVPGTLELPELCHYSKKIK